MDQTHSRTVPVEVKRGFHRRIPPADNHHICIEVPEWFIVVMRDVRQVLSRHAEAVRVVEVSRGDDHVLRNVHRSSGRPDLEPACGTAYRLYPVKAPDVEPMVSDHFLVVVERIDARGTDCGNDEGDPPYFEELGSGEPDQVCREPPDIIDKAPFLEHDHTEPCFLRLDRARETGRPRTDDHDICRHFHAPRLK